MGAAWRGDLSGIRDITSLFKDNATLEYLINIQDSDGDTAIHDAARRNHLDVVKFLIELKANVKIRNNKGKDVLANAQEYGCDTEIVQFLQTLN